MAVQKLIHDRCFIRESICALQCRAFETNAQMIELIAQSTVALSRSREVLLETDELLERNKAASVGGFFHSHLSM
jgi:hypothetical protein